MGISVILLMMIGEGQALPLQLFFLGKPKNIQNSEQVAQICQILKSSGEELVRLQSIEDLRSVEGVSQPMAIVALSDSMVSDRKAGVRAEAALALSKMRPVRQEVGAALEKAITNDPSMRVRLQARSALLQYNLAGYRSAQNAPVTALDPLGQIAKEPSPILPNPKSGILAWVASTFSYGESFPKDLDKANPLENKKSWYRPGKNIMSWWQGATGFADGTIKDPIHGLGTLNQTRTTTAAPSRLPNQEIFPIIPDFTPGLKPTAVPTKQDPIVGPELGNPKS